MSSNKPPSELGTAVNELMPYFRQAALFSVFASLLILAPSVYMLEVYDRVVNTRSHMTLAMLTVVVLFAFVVMEVLEWVRSVVMHEASLVFDRRMSGRIFTAIFEANLKRMPGGSAQPMNDFRSVRDFLSAPVVLALMVCMSCLSCSTTNRTIKHQSFWAPATLKFLNTSWSRRPHEFQ